ncbi:hypothetical protein RB195_026041 [Necator americanus]|uniref:Uncharacterized protein n=1 Tax=Necator americanus TaxID=51031 RepID=A0ABR1EV63_NECAM
MKLFCFRCCILNFTKLSSIHEKDNEISFSLMLRLQLFEVLIHRREGQPNSIFQLPNFAGCQRISRI